MFSIINEKKRNSDYSEPKVETYANTEIETLKRK